MEPTASLVVLAVLGLYFGDEEPVAAMLDHMTRFETTEWSEYHLSALCSSFAAIAPFFPDLAPLAVENAERSLAIALRCGNPTALANALFAMGLTHEADPDTASAFYDQSIALIESGATDTVLSHAHRGASRVARLRGDMASSIEHLIAAIEHADRVGDHPSLGNALDETVFVLCDTEDVEGSTILFARTEAGVLNGLLLPDDARRVAANAERARVQLGEDVYAAAHHRGATMSERELVAFALDRLEAVARQVAAG
jgi:hypothetical protein